MTAPLEGIRILDLTQALSGPVATRILGDLGAEVIKIEPRQVGEVGRRMGVSFVEGEGVYFMIYNRSKKGITLDLRTDKGKAVLHRLVQVSDVVFDNFRPGVMARLGADYQTVRAINPSIICCSVSGYGKDGPYRDRPVFDSVIQGVSGAMSVTGEPGGPPAVMGFAVSDIGGGWGATVGILSALMSRERTGEGREVDISMLDVQLTFQGHHTELYLGGGIVPGPGGSVQSANLPNGAFLTKDGKYLQLHCATQKFYQVLADMLAANVKGFEELPQDQRFTTIDGRRENWDELKALLEAAFATKSASEWMDLLGDEVPLAPVNTIADAFNDPQVLHRNMLVEAEHPVAGKYKMPGNPVKMGQEEVFRPAPTLGQHNREVLGDLLGYTEEEMRALEGDEVI